MSNKDDKKLVGASVPNQLFNKITLFSLASGTSKSEVIRNALLFWMEQNNATIETIIHVLKKKYQGEWLAVKNSAEEKDYKALYGEHLTKCRGKLLSESVPQEYVNQILDFPL